MAGRAATSVRRDRLVLAAALLVLAVVALGLASLELNRTVAGATRSPSGTLDLLTDDPRAGATVRLSLDAEHPADSLLVDIGVRSRRDEVAFALVLRGDAARTGIEHRSLSVLSREVQGLWVGRDAVDAWFVNGAGPALVNFGPPAPSALIVGRAHRSAPDEPIRVAMVVPVAGEFVTDTASGFEFRLPTLGGGKGWFTNLTLSAGADGRRVVAPAAAVIEGVRWQPLRVLRAAASLSDLGVDDRVDATPPATSVGPGERTWQASGALEVAGSVDRADDIRRAQRRQFIAGVAVGLAGALLVGSLGIVVMVSREVRRSRFV